AELAHEAHPDLCLAVALLLVDAFGIVDVRCADVRAGAHLFTAQGAGQRQAPGCERLAPADGRFPVALDHARVQRLAPRVRAFALGDAAAAGIVVDLAGRLQRQ